MQIILPGIHGSGELWLDIMKIICGDTQGKSMVDLMCHKAPYTPQLRFASRTYVDIQDRGMDFIEEKGNFVCMDVVHFIYENINRYDVAICSDGIEHLTIREANEVTWGMVGMSDKQIFFTPLGEQSVTNDSHPDSHKTGWTPESKNIQHCDTIVFPDFHPTLNCGAFFAYNCHDVEKKRIYNEITNKYVKN